MSIKYCACITDKALEQLKYTHILQLTCVDNKAKMSNILMCIAEALDTTYNYDGLYVSETGKLYIDTSKAIVPGDLPCHES